MYVFLFTSLDKCCGGGFFSSDNGTCSFGDILELAHCQWIYSSDLPALGSLQRKENDTKTDK